MIDYAYRTTNAYACVADKEEAICALDIVQKESESKHEHERKCIAIQVCDTGESHEGLVLNVQAYGESSQAASEWYKKTNSKNSWLDICSLYLSTKQAKELICAIQNALAMREFDDEEGEDE